MSTEPTGGVRWRPSLPLFGNTGRRYPSTLRTRSCLAQLEEAAGGAFLSDTVEPVFVPCPAACPRTLGALVVIAPYSTVASSRSTGNFRLVGGHNLDREHTLR